MLLTDYHINKRFSATFLLGEKVEAFKALLPYWMMHFKHGCILDGNRYSTHHTQPTELTLAVSDEVGLLVSKEDATSFELLKSYHEKEKDWLFGFLSYDLKNHVEDLESDNLDRVGLPLMHFFSPDILVRVQGNEVAIESKRFTPEKVWRSIWDAQKDDASFCTGNWEMKSRETEDEYKATVAKIREHIIEGDIYEMNYCTEFYIESCNISPAALYTKLNHIANAPFSSFYKCDDRYLICGSPERFMKKEGNKVTSQPIKGTAPRGKTPEEDLAYKTALANSEKDQAENVMIVDLVRNDLSRNCRAGTVEVEELFGIHGFEQVWHMISTISGELRDDVHFVDAIKAAFPMGSMTGAPKVMAMELIEQYEKTSRGLYSGSVGYISPEGDFDFNVVIRSILFNSAEHYLSYHVGGAIVYDSEPEKEYQECLLKAQGMRKALGVE